ncbi:hypothetical protein [Persicitalea jodogahamensis]|uniref:Uncharacterized protein n=1 Tax=Persicitalea jodogahamensis TaxID=402147 RepID=A0A8J3G970_9BACT|nr:hypothetical protein [Persicitalea jodogahamensis]GHB64174.1 hypothetical protein GCM10007390_17570 [Persicitalea jodogahamensis]
MQTIYVKDVRRQIDLLTRFEDRTFSITYRKKDGSYGEKQNCRNRSGHIQSGKKADLLSVRRENSRAGYLRFEFRDQGGRWLKRDVLLCLLVTFNGYLIDHRF